MAKQQLVGNLDAGISSGDNNDNPSFPTTTIINLENLLSTFPLSSSMQRGAMQGCYCRITAGFGKETCHLFLAADRGTQVTQLPSHPLHTQDTAARFNSII